MSPMAAEVPSTPVREKRAVAVSSVLAACLLVGGKLAIGLSTHSLGVLSEAAHSGLDLIAAVVTLFAVSASSQPADSEHPYGHAKIENLSALLETILLSATCVWIVYEALRRLFYVHVQVDASLWAFVTILASIAIDFSRSRALSRVAKKYQSQALEADALHFSTDIWSSLVVLAGLILVRLAEATGIRWLLRADAAAALGVAAIVLWISYRLGHKTVNDLLDAIPPALREAVERTARVPGVLEVHQARLRRAGPDFFADLTLGVDQGLSLEVAHDLATRAEEAIRGLLPGADVVVHVEPVAQPAEAIPATVRRLAARQGLSAHGIRQHSVRGRQELEMHLETDETLSVAEAHRRVTGFEEALRAAHPDLGSVLTHIEPARRGAVRSLAVPVEEAEAAAAVARLPGEMGIAFSPHEVSVRRIEGELHLSFHCVLDASAGVADAHALTEEMERRLRRTLPELGRVLIRVEPRSRDLT